MLLKAVPSRSCRQRSSSRPSSMARSASRGRTRRPKTSSTGRWYCRIAAKDFATQFISTTWSTVSFLPPRVPKPSGSASSCRDPSRSGGPSSSARFAKAVRTNPPEFWPADSHLEVEPGNYARHQARGQEPQAHHADHRALVSGAPGPAGRPRCAARSAEGFRIKHYFGAGARQPGEHNLPDPQLLKLYAAKAYVDNKKAARLLGYSPRYDFAAGMEPTRRYLEWAYGELSKMVAAMAAPSSAADGQSGRAGGSGQCN